MKFNLSTYEKISGDEHIEQRLRGEHKEEENEITEEQLEVGRVAEKEVLIEKLLEKTRTGENDVLPEKRFETSKSGLYDHRNSSAFEGDINKLEEKRLSGDPVEDEKYEAASETPKQFRWWEEGGSPDGLKLAENKKPMKRKAQEDDEITFDEPERWGRLPKVWSDEEEGAGFSPEPSLRDFDVDVVEDDTPLADDLNNGPAMYIVTKKYFSEPQSAIYMSIDFKPEEFRGLNKELRVREEAMNHVLLEDPGLRGLVTLDDFSVEDMEGSTGTVTLRIIGDELEPVVLAHKQGQETMTEEHDEQEDFKEVNFETRDMGGTPMASGTISIVADVNDEDTEEVVSDAIEFLRTIRPEVKVTPASFDTSRIKEGKLTYIVQLEENQEDFDFDVEDDNLSSIMASASVKKKIK